MITDDLERIARRTAHTQRAVNARLRAKASAAAKEVREARERREQVHLEQEMDHFAQLAGRVGHACEGLKVLCAFGRSRAFQTFVKERSEALVLWGNQHATTPGGDMADVYWKYTTMVAMTEAAIVAEHHIETSGDYGRTFRQHPAIPHVRFEVPYLARSLFPHQLHLWRIAGDHLDLQEIERSDDDLFHSTDALFQVFVDCADPERLESLFYAATFRR